MYNNFAIKALRLIAKARNGIAIIAILAAILFPVFAQAKAAAKKTSALSNVKQTTLGVMMYLGDNDDVFPMGSGYCGIYRDCGGWSIDTQPYIKSLAILRDPSDPMAKKTYQSWYDYYAAVDISFASNGYLDNLGSGWSLYGVMGFNQDKSTTPGGWMDRGVTSQSSVNQVSNTIALAARYNGNTCFLGGDLMTGQNWWDSTGPGLLPNGDPAARNGTPYQAPDINGNAYTVNVDNRFGAIGSPYANNGVFAFVDGHAKAMNPVATNPNQLANPEKNLWNAYR
ncbi:hypothetical protein BH11ARM1_BH11ARM1_10220 [soil metagenome]